MKDDYNTNSHYLTYTFLFKKVGRMYFSNLGVKGLKTINGYNRVMITFNETVLSEWRKCMHMTTTTSLGFCPVFSWTIL